MSTYESNRYNFSGSNLTALNGSNISSGTVADARIPNLATSKITSGTFADARFASSNITQHVDLTNLSASNLTSGTVPNARYGTPTFNGSSLTNMSVASSTGTWSPSTPMHSFSYLQAKYVKVGRICFITLYGQVSTPSSGSPEDDQFYFSGLPFTSWNGGNPVGGGIGIYPNWTYVMTQVDANSNKLYLFKAAGDEIRHISTYGNRGRLNRNYSSYPGQYRAAQDRYMYFECTYITAS